MRCFHAPEEKLELVGCYLQRKAGFGEHGFDFQYCDNQNFDQSFEKPQIYTKNPKFPTFYSETFVEKSHYYGGPIERSVTDHHNKSILDEGHGSWFMERMESPYKWCFFQNMISTYTKDSSHKK
jgi:hypothetical protein